MNKDRSMNAGKLVRIVSSIRSSIAHGVLAPGRRLPPRIELEAQFQVSPVTIQKAMDELTHGGFVRSRGSLGTFVTDHPPCLHRYGIVFPHTPADKLWGGYYNALLQVGHELGGVPDCEIVFYFGVEYEGQGDYETLLGDVQSERLAGLFFANGPWFLVKTPLLQQDLVPCMAMMEPENEEDFPNFTVADFDVASLCETAIGTLVEKGCQRPAVLIGEGYHLYLPFVRHALDAHHLPYRPAMLRGVSLAAVELAEHVASLWMELTAEMRPDGLFIADDNLVNGACSGLLRAGVHPGVDLPVAVHSNFPTRAGGLLPLDHVGYDIRALVRLFIDTSNARRRGEPFEKHLKMAAVHESELGTAARQSAASGALQIA